MQKLSKWPSFPFRRRTLFTPSVSRQALRWDGIIRPMRSASSLCSCWRQLGAECVQQHGAKRKGFVHIIIRHQLPDPAPCRHRFMPVSSNDGSAKAVFAQAVSRLAAIHSGSAHSITIQIEPGTRAAAHAGGGWVRHRQSQTLQYSAS